jgi:hypothetical protein
MNESHRHFLLNHESEITEPSLFNAVANLDLIRSFPKQPHELSQAPQHEMTLHHLFSRFSGEVFQV